MIGLVFNRPPTEKPKTESWWVSVPRSLWKSVYRWEHLHRLRLQKSVPEPTARKEQPDWQRKWDERRKEQMLLSRVRGSCVPEAERATASTDLDSSDD